ncbi:MAG TPA: energy transducer TonB [Bryobacteraceae bacterium]|jgi:TonB family protein|nr:energy transducer TonB [Bryobacteraceae bacterium]
MPDDNLSRLLLTETGESFYKSLWRSLKELVHPATLPPLEVTSKPVVVQDIWGLYGRQKKSFLFSTGFQVAAVVLIFTALSSKTVQKQIQQVVPLILPDAAPPPKPVTRASGGGGGGDRSPLPASKGRLPKPAPRQFVPPTAVLNNPQPKLAMEASILAPPDANLPNVNLPNYGDPLGHLGPPSNGTGSGGGIGSGKGGGVGSGTGGGAGPGDGGGIVYNPGKGGVTQPQLIHQEEPEFSDEARKARFQGVVVVAIEVDEHGRVVHPHVVHSAGLGLDEKAIEAALKWTFLPGTLNGKPVVTRASITMSFHLL